MHPAQFDHLLETGSFSDVEDSADCESCAVIDWRAEPDEVVEAFQSFLPQGFLRVELPDETSLVVLTASRKTDVALRTELPAIPLADELIQLLRPEHSAFLLRSSIGSDTAVYVVRPASWWQSFRTGHPERFERLFTEERHSQ